jgi:hypothetical protein
VDPGSPPNQGAPGFAGPRVDPFFPGLRFSTWGKSGPPRALARMSGQSLDLFPAVFWVVRTIVLDVGERTNPQRPLKDACSLGISVAFRTAGQYF